MLPMKYEPLKTTLKFLDSNIRFQLSVRFPSLRTTEKVVPLKLDHLTLANCQTTVNKTSYQLEIIQDVHPREVIPKFDHTNDCGRPIRRDIDRYGFKDKSEINLVTPGDLNLRSERKRQWNEFDHRSNRIEAYNMNKLRQAEIAMRLSIQADIERRKVIDAGLFVSILNEIEDSAEHLEPYWLRQDNAPPRYTLYIKFTITSGTQKYTEILVYNRKIHEALKYLNTLLFGNRREAISVNMLALENQKHIYRLPIDFKVRVKELNSEFLDINEFNGTIQFAEQYKMTIGFDFWRGELLGQQLYRRAQQLTFLPNPHDHDDNIIDPDTLRAVENLNVRVQEWDENDLIELIREWIQNGKPINSCYSFGMKSRSAAEKCFRKVKKEFRESLTQNQARFVTLPMPHGLSQLRISYMGALRGVKSNYWFKRNWCLKLEVERVD